MASIKSTLLGILVVLLLAVVVAGGTYGYLLWQRHAVRQELTLADNYLAQNQPQEAERLLAPRLEMARRGSAWAPQALALRLRALDALGDATAAANLARQLLNPDKPWVRPGQEAWARAHLALGRAALESNQAGEAQVHFEALLAQPAGTAGRAEASVGMARLEMAAGKVIEARNRLNALYSALSENTSGRDDVERLLGDLNMRLLMWPQPQGDDQIHVIVKGDTLDRLRKRYKIAPDLLMAINHIDDPKRLTIGRRLKIPALELSILVNKTDNTLTLLDHGKFFKKYPVRTGKFDYLTPVGDYTIENKVVSPPWRNPQTGQAFGPDAPGNELGCRWMGFVGTNLGIHEAIDPKTVGTYGSNGCVGMKRDDVVEVFSLVPRGTPVKIIGQIAAGSAAAIPPLLTPSPTSSPTPTAPAGAAPAPTPAP
ncbi:MAG: L,D-transpeptidase family protein [bacterium]|nr:L,D-transpeptidase family protein [bacterium]